jgi:hypothetical protein
MSTNQNTIIIEELIAEGKTEEEAIKILENMAEPYDIDDSSKY